MTKTKVKAKTKPDPKRARKAREGKLIAELCQKHGYMLQDAPKGKRIVMTFNQNAKPAVDASYKITLIVPSTSALGEQFAVRYGLNKKPKQ